MAENSSKHSALNDDEDNIDLIGNLIMKIESVLSPKPINVWHLPGALQRILSSVLVIISHGCKTDSESKSQLWNFIFGLRVIRPDLWPTYELKSSGSGVSNTELVSQWLELSLQSHLLRNQLKTLLDDRERLHKYYHSWAFLRARKYTEALLTVLQALEHNSQDTLATLNPSLMVKFYSKRKKCQEKVINFSLPNDVQQENNNTFYSSTSNGIAFTKKTSDEQLESNSDKNEDPAVAWDGNAFSESPKTLSSFLQVDYDSAVFSDAEKVDSKENLDPNPHEINHKSFSERDLRTCSSMVGAGGSLSNRMRKQNLQDTSNCSRSYSNNLSELSKRCRSSCYSSRSDSNDLLSSGDARRVVIDGRNYIQPSSFLLEYLSTKSRFPMTSPSPTLEEELDDDIASTETEMSTQMSQSYPVKCKNSESYSIKCKNSDHKRCESFPSLPPAISSSFVSTRTYTAQRGNPQVEKTPMGQPASDCEGLGRSAKVTKRSHSRSHSDGSRAIVSEKPVMRKTSVSYSDRSLASPFSAQAAGNSMGRVSSVKKTFMEDGGQSITPVADGFFPQPQPGQTLLDFLTSTQFTKASAQLDRENAHFSVAEAVLAAIEQMNYETCRMNERRQRPQFPDESEEDISSRQQFRSHRRKLRDRSSVPFCTGTSDEEPVTTDHSIFDSPEPQSSDHGSDSESASSELRSEVVDADSEGHTSCSGDPSSAENVAIAILMRYNSKLLPKASELQWLVTEQEAPQKLLPMPTSVPVSPDDAEGETVQPLLRGTSDWAPPRPQLILTLHKNTKRKARLIDQKWRCAGCGLLVSEKLSSYFRLCHYLGRFFCTSCHTNQKAVVPAKVLHKWDFKKYAVCNFSSELLLRMSSDPLFHLGTLNPRLYKQSRDLHQTLIYRLQLFHARAYIFTCSKATKEKTLLEKVPVHWSTEPHVYSLDDLLGVKKGVSIPQMKHLTMACINHISNCQICLGQGFICEICRGGSPIFPFQLDAVTQCTKCRECFHFICFSPNGSCPRCERRDKREGKKDTRTPTD